MIKKELLFVIDSLDIAGAEKSLVTLLNLLDYTKYNVDLQLFAYGHTLEELIPKEVNMLEPMAYTVFSHLPIKKAIIQSINKSQISMLASRMKFSFSIRKKKCGNRERARMFWECASSVIEKKTKRYDIAISYAQGVPTFYVADKIEAKRKLAWVNVSYPLTGEEKDFQKQYYKKYDHIVAVSDSTKEIFAATFPEFREKLKVISDINDPKFICNMARIGSTFDDDFHGTRILTIGRLAHQKGYDVALDACRHLKEKGLEFKWYVLGKGPLQNEIEQSIKERGLEKHFILLGVTANPYPYIKEADIYVQTSRYEGFGIAIAEARMLNTPVVTTRFDAVYSQMIPGKNGLVVERNATAVSEAVKKLIENDQLKQKIKNYLIKEKKGNVEELEKFYHLLGSV
ncbi:glycosyltransferase [Virgibacillus sp. W0430]|uniref:glycosyltransferase n=1 Tax=Virgibacillus sp. W0430 TaxID=3391580 RepID=UPI003F487D0A